jgi:hypothetical protein
MTCLVLMVSTVLGCATSTEKAPLPPAPQEAALVEPAPEVETHKNTLTWKIASELDNFGFDVYRGESEEGPFERINKKTIPGAGSTDALTQYSFVDATIDPYKTYWYYVESISLSGHRERFTPVFAAKPKL